MFAKARGDTLGVPTKTAVMPNHILAGGVLSEPDVLLDGLPEPEIGALFDSEEYSDSDEDIVWGWVEESQEHWIPKINRYCGSMLSTECPHCKDLSPVWEPVYPADGILNRETEEAKKNKGVMM